MNNLPASAQPSMASLLKALVIAFALAAVLLVLVVLPAERNIDLTGFGKALGLTALSAPEPEPTRPASDASQEPEATGMAIEDQTVVDIPPGKGVEYKFYLRAGARMEYDWKLDRGVVFYDFHGEPKGAPAEVFESFAAGDAAGAKGTLTAPFEGTHGWYWKNRGSEPVQVTLVTSGVFEVLGLR